MRRLILLTVLLPVLALAAVRDDYAQQWPLTLGRDAGGAYRVTLDEGVYRQLQDPALRDFVVLNRDGAAVPAALFAPEQPLAKASQRLSLPWFLLLRTPTDGSDPGWELVSKVDADGRLSQAYVHLTRPTNGVLRKDVLLIDLSRVREAIVALELHWQPIDALDLGYRVEASDDLEHWQMLPTRGRLIDLQREDRRLLHRRIELYGLLPHYQKARYLRLTPDRSDQPITITGVDAELAAAKAAPTPQWLELAGRRVETDGSDAFEFDVAGRFPVQQVDVALPGNHAVEWRLESRDSDDADWQPRVGLWVAYQVDASGSGSQSPARVLSQTLRDRHWRLRASGEVSGEPTLRLGYRPEVVVFLAQGPAPYALAAGSTRAHRADSPIPQLVAELRKQRGANWQPSPAYLGAPRMLAGDAALHTARDWKSWLLWAVLALGALVVAGFALTLLRVSRPAARAEVDAGDDKEDDKEPESSP